jgi:uncharacterized protein (DUF1330 family)
MPKAYWVATYHKIKDPEKVAAYAKLAGPALVAAGAKFLARGMPVKVYENGVMERTVIQEWASVEAAIEGHDSPGYQEALRVLGDGCEREIRIIEAAE